MEVKYIARILDPPEKQVVVNRTIYLFEAERCSQVRVKIFL